jgi:hypothetical protein
VPASGETLSFAEGRITLWASASGSTSGSGVGFCEDATLRLTYGWLERRGADGAWSRYETGRRADLDISHLYAWRTLYALADASAAVNARFQGRAGGLTQSGQWDLYSGVITRAELRQADGAVWRGQLAAHFYEWSAFGQG